jgi:hypothetical protein
MVSAIETRGLAAAAEPGAGLSAPLLSAHLPPTSPVVLIFDRKLLSDPAVVFKPEVYLHELSNVPLPEIRRDLVVYLQALKTELVELINRDYAELINLSSNLTGVNKLIAELKRHLDVIEIEVRVRGSSIPGKKKKRKEKASRGHGKPVLFYRGRAVIEDGRLPH